MHHTLVALVEDKPGVLNRVASLFRRRAFNIESLTVGRTDVPGISRMTVVIDSDQVSVERVTAYLYKLVNVLYVADVTHQSAVVREMALIKVRAVNGHRAEILQLCDVFRARVVDVGSDSLCLEITGTQDKIDGLIEVLKPFGLLEMVRTGAVAMLRGQAENGAVAPDREAAPIQDADKIVAA